MTTLHRVTWTETVRYSELVELPEDWDDLDAEDQGDWVADNVEDLDAAYLACEEREILSCERTSPADAKAHYWLEAGRKADERIKQEREEYKRAAVKELRDAMQALAAATEQAEETGDYSKADALDDAIVPLVRGVLRFL
ncbi:hypothetical protein [Dietzia sp. 179-F 9C3 NHS]|uniref:hypothetical protein n=1 Tax=Dietzia sp. 179-F 9C3 NHS TaxID=3374295 RepID=UPI0038790EAB